MLQYQSMHISPPLSTAVLIYFFFPGESSGDGRDGLMQLGLPDDVDVSVEFRDWLFALEGAQEMAERWCFYSHEGMSREERCWHTTFRSLSVKARSSPKEILNGKEDSLSTHKYPVELVIVSSSTFLSSLLSCRLQLHFNFRW